MLKYILAAMIAGASTVALGSGPVAFDLPQMNAAHPETYSTEGKGVMLIEFYFNGCGACNSNAANVERIYEEFNARAAIVEFGYDCDDGEYRSWISKHSPAAPVLKGCDSPVLDQLNVQQYPTAVILDKNHNVVWRSVGVWSTATIREIRSKLASLTR